jgi:hypothetical protein
VATLAAAKISKKSLPVVDWSNIVPAPPPSPMKGKEWRYFIRDSQTGAYWVSGTGTGSHDQVAWDMRWEKATHFVELGDAHTMKQRLDDRGKLVAVVSREIEL